VNAPSPIMTSFTDASPRRCGRTEHAVNDAVKSITPWVTFAGGVLVVAVLYWAQAVLVPFALAVLLTFVLAPPVSWLERWVGRVTGVLLAVTLVFATLGLAGWRCWPMTAPRRC
jgi:predicted PurR-regulated permease PerM